ncbi:class II glutamine amidotransferase [Lutimonas halocynthiae]|uniref:class II glutamine amidotransferase n=1 Tax=Lutimonas halocynthiae TaxID=1446477 RepID=UPI0025B35A20|nr:class II glutamine amidotransferase [Lutimonas halocynthiae]MDN3641684.1 class II glutamine amidotransferase [Lutimonas halocynthiae]
MCRFIAYIGKPIFADELLLKPKNSLMKQSYHALEAEMTVNGDGFGIGWYNHFRRKEPALFRSIRPAWNDENLSYNASMIKTNCLLAHIRAATQGGVSIQNSHPFQYKEFLMMQNGGIHDFAKIKKKLISRLDDEVFQWIQGQTDTQYIFALFITFSGALKRKKGSLTLDDLSYCLSQTFAEIEKMKKEEKMDAPSLYNLVLTNGKALIATRYSTQPEVETRSLHIASNAECCVSEDGDLTFKPMTNNENSVLISSEVLNDNKEFWQEVPENHCIMVKEDMSVEIKPIN